MIIKHIFNIYRPYKVQSISCFSHIISDWNFQFQITVLLAVRHYCTAASVAAPYPPQAPRARLLNHNNYKSNCSKSMSSSTHSSIITLLTMVLCCYCYCYPSPKEQFFIHPPPHQKQIHFIICVLNKTLSLKS